MSAETKLELLGLIDQAVADGWAHTRACRVLDLADSRVHHWRARLRETGTLEDGDPGGGAVHGILAWEEQAILDLIETWGPVDRSHRKLAHRGSYTASVFVSPSTVLRVALKNRGKLPGEPFRPRPGKPVFPEIPWEKNRIWRLLHDLSGQPQAPSHDAGTYLRDRTRRRRLGARPDGNGHLDACWSTVGCICAAKTGIEGGKWGATQAAGTLSAGAASLRSGLTPIAVFRSGAGCQPTRIVEEPIWIWDATHFTRCKRVTYAIVDVVTRYWIGYLLTSEQTHTQVQLLFARALEDQDLLDADGRPPAAEDGLPILVAWSDNGAEMTAIDTRQFMALMAITQHHGRPGTPTDQAHIESFFSHLKRDWPHLLEIRDPAVLDTELHRIRTEYNTTRLHASIGYVTPDDEHHGRGPGIRRARAAGLKRARRERIKHNRANKT